jgi:hypothetical protein
MPHPDGGKRPIFQTQHSFTQALVAVQKKNDGVKFLSSTDHSTNARIGDTDCGTPAIAFHRASMVGMFVRVVGDLRIPAQARELANGYVA